MQQILKGKPVVEGLRQQLQGEVKKSGREVTLAIVLVGDDPASHYYKNHLVKLAQTIGVTVKIHALANDADTQSVIHLIEELNKNPAVDGILPMMPLPGQIEAGSVTEAINALKDIDCLSSKNAGLLYLGKSLWAPCTAKAVMYMLKYYGLPVQGKRVVILGRSNVVGKPLLPLMLAENATVTICHSKTVDLPELAREADILVAAVGVPAFVTQEMVKKGAVLIDVGINQTDKGMVGDIAPAALALAAAYTPVPGGIGTVSSMMVMQALVLKNRK